MNGQIKTIVIVGGGTAGWMTAAGLANKIAPLMDRIILVESDDIGTVGVGEATLPHLRFFNKTLGIDEPDLMKATEATIKLGIQFCDWGKIGDAYIHPFGDFGQPLHDVGFHHYWNKANALGQTPRIDTYSYPVIAAERGRFMLPSDDPQSIFSTFSYAYQFDAGLYAKYLRRYAETRGILRHEGRITGTDINSETGYVTAVCLEDGTRIEGDLFIDCSGFRALLSGGALDVGFEDWSQWLPCDRAVAVASQSDGAPLPYTRATAREAGWQWRIPLQHRTGNGYVYWSDHISEDEATSSLLSRLDGAPLTPPKSLRFKTGKRERLFDRNVVAIGLSAGFLEPLESTSIHLIQEGITKLIDLFPTGGIPHSDRDAYNRLMDLEYERVRDFLLLHYVATTREDTPFWRHFRDLTLPDSLTYKIDAFKKRGIIVEYEKGCFLPPSWLAVFLGQGIVPDHYDPRVDRLPTDGLGQSLQQMRNGIHNAVEQTSSHMDFLEQYGARSFTAPLAAAP